MKKLVIALTLVGLVALVGCTKPTEKTSNSKNSSSTKVTKKNNYDTTAKKKEMLAKIEKAEIAADDDVWKNHTNEEELRTSNNGMQKLVGLTGETELVGYKTYRIPDTWELDYTRTSDKEQDAIWQVYGDNGIDSYVEVYMLPTYKGDIADLQGERLTEDDLDSILADDGAKFTQIGKTKINEIDWHVGLEMGDGLNTIRVTFYRMEEDKGDFNESVQVAQLIGPLSNIMESKENQEAFLKEVSKVKKMLTTFSETKEKEVPAS